ncbi:hypothetical protein ACFL35_10570 [Candidatus Riflebacteria bacterium]
MKYLLILLFLFSFLNVNHPAENDNDDSSVVIVEGIGRNQIEAEKNALRIAVNQVVGSLVDNSTFIENDEIIKDKVLTYSAGFVKQWRPIGTPQTESNGRIRIKIKATVKKSKLIRKLTDIKVYGASVDGKSLFGEAVTQIERKLNAVELLKNNFEGIPEKLLLAEILNKKIVKIGNPSVLELEILVKFDYKAYFKKFLPKILKIFDNICLEKCPYPYINKASNKIGYEVRNWQGANINWGYNKYHRTLKSEDFHNLIAINTERNYSSQTITWNLYVVDTEVKKFLRREIFNKTVNLNINFIGARNRSIKNKIYFREHIFDRPLFSIEGKNSVLVIFPCFSNSRKHHQRFYGKNFWDAFNFKIQESFTLSELKKITKIECTFVEVRDAFFPVN